MTSTAGARTRGRWLGGLALGVLVALAAGDGPPVEVWTATYDGGAGNDIGYAVAIDSQGNVLTAGYLFETLTGTTDLGYNGFLQKRGYDGDVAWTKILDNTTTDTADSRSGDQYLGVCVDGADDVIVGGVWSGDWGGGDGYHGVAMVQKLDPHGSVLWEWRGDGSYGAWSAVRAVAVDPAGFVVAAGNTFTSWGPIQHQWAIWKLSPDGVLQPGYPKYHNVSPVHEISDLAYGIDVYSDGSFVVVGTIGIAVGDGSTTKDMDWHVRRYDANGDLAWDDTYSGSASLNDAAFGVALDALGNAYVVGYANEGTNNTDAIDYEGVIVKYSPSGTRLWTVHRPGDAGEQYLYRDVALDADGTLTVVGYHRPAGADSYEGLSEGRNPSNGDLYGETVDGGSANTLLLSVASRGRLVAATGYFGPAGSYDLFTVLGELPNSAPVIDAPAAAGTDLGAVDEPIAFSVGAHDPDDDPLTITWDFGDGTYAAGPNPTHVFATPGQKLVDVTVSDGLDAAQDSLVVTVGQPLEAPSVKASLNFKKPGKDVVLFKCWLDLTPLLLIDGETVTFDVGGIEETFTLDRKGKAKSDGGKVSLKYKKKKGLWQLTAKLGKNDFSEDLADEGLVDATQKKTPVVIKATVELGVGIQCAHMVEALYTAKAGKWGKTK